MKIAKKIFRMLWNLLAVLGLAVVVLWGTLAYWSYQNKRARQQQEGWELVLATRDLSAGTTIERNDVRAAWTANAKEVPKGPIPRRLSEVIGHRALTPIAKDEVILTNELSH
jgi:Flp pilus assembly protein CpaB